MSAVAIIDEIIWWQMQVCWEDSWWEGEAAARWLSPYVEEEWRDEHRDLWRKVNKKMKQQGADCFLKIFSW